MKKIILVLIITALSLFVSTAVVTANDEGFSGVYEMSSTGSCLHSIDGWMYGGGPPYIPVNIDAWAATTMAHGTWTFNRDGTGVAGGENYVIDFPPGITPGPFPLGSGPMARGNPFSFEFNYDVTSKGVITVTLDSGFVLEGRVSVDKKTVTIPSAYQDYDLTAYGLGFAVCNTARVLIRVKDIREKD